MRQCIQLVKRSSLFIVDYLRSLFNECYTCKPSSYYLLRWLYRVTRSNSQFVLAAPYQFLCPPLNESRTGLFIAREVAENGYSLISPTANMKSLCSTIKSKLAECSVVEIGGLNSGRSYTCSSQAIDLGLYQCARLGYNRTDVVAIPEVWELLVLIDAYAIASSYLSCRPIITSVDSWHVVPFVGSKSEADQSYCAAAQSYHYDMDWIRFIKFFINLDSVDDCSGPFEFVPGSHRNKNTALFHDRRLSILETSSLPRVHATGPCGSVFIADTSGLHRDGRAQLGYSRHVLQVEFAVSLFGAKFQYNQDNAQCVVPSRHRLEDLWSERALLLWQKG
jgi:hypothetical protein